MRPNPSAKECFSCETFVEEHFRKLVEEENARLGGRNAPRAREWVTFPNIAGTKEQLNRARIKQ